MRAARVPAGCPAPVAPLPPRASPRSVTFSMATTVTFSMAIDTCRPLGCAVIAASPGRQRAGVERVGRGAG